MTLKLPSALKLHLLFLKSKGYFTQSTLRHKTALLRFPETHTFNLYTHCTAVWFSTTAYNCATIPKTTKMSRRAPGPWSPKAGATVITTKSLVIARSFQGNSKCHLWAGQCPHLNLFKPREVSGEISPAMSINSLTTNKNSGERKSSLSREE